MEINLHYGENVTLAQLKKIASFGINVEVLNGNYLIVFDILDGSEQHQRLKAEFPDLAPICEWYIFSEKEMQEAEWFNKRKAGGFLPRENLLS